VLQTGLHTDIGTYCIDTHTLIYFNCWYSIQKTCDYWILQISCAVSRSSYDRLCGVRNKTSCLSPV